MQMFVTYIVLFVTAVKARFSDFSLRTLLCLPLLAIWTSPKAKLSTVDCLEADRLYFGRLLL